MPYEKISFWKSPKAGIQGSYTTPLRTYWIPAFAGMTLSLHFFTSSENK
jgi:hypothetical protein